MITKIDIERFGLFSNYCWKQHIGTENNHIFSKMNIIYGRNYSGKTTLSRIFRCIEMKQLHNNYHNGIFAITTDNSTITNTNTQDERNMMMLYSPGTRSGLCEALTLMKEQLSEDESEPFCFGRLGSP